jgi:hypothetical protein
MHDTCLHPYVRAYVRWYWNPGGLGWVDIDDWSGAWHTNLAYVCQNGC